MTPEERAEWLDWRRGGVGASDIASAHSGRYGGAYKVIADKLGIIVDDIPQELADRGERWEPPVADAVHALTGLYVGGAQLWLESPKNPQHRCTPDGLLFATPEPAMSDALGGLEIKTKGARAPWQWLYWNTQCQWAMHVTGLERWLLAVATIDEEFDTSSGALTEIVTGLTCRMVYADAFLQAHLVELAGRILARVAAGSLPDPEDAVALPYVKQVNMTADPDADVDIDDFGPLLARHEDLKAAQKLAADEVATSEARIRHRMGTATEATTTDGTWRVRVGEPVRKFIARSETDFVQLYCEHRDDCEPGCTVHRPDLLDATLNRKLAKEKMPEEYDALRIPTADRRLTIKYMELRS